MYKSYLIWIGVLAIMILVLPGSARSQHKTGEGEPRILRYALHSSEMGSFDPDFAKGSQNNTYADMVFNALWRYVPGDARSMEPDLAAEMPKFDTVNGRQVWTVHLRHKVFFHESPYSPAPLNLNPIPEGIDWYSGPMRDISGEDRNWTG